MLNLPLPQPLPLQYSELLGILVLRRSVFVRGEGDEFEEAAFPAHAQLLDQLLRSEVVVLDVGVDASGFLLQEKVAQQRAGAFAGIADALVGRVEVPAYAVGIGLLLHAEQIANNRPGLLQSDGQVGVVLTSFNCGGDGFF